MSVWALYFDGLCEPSNPGGRICWGFSIHIPGRQSVTGHGTKPPAPSNSNNQAEYIALGFGLRRVNELKEAEGSFDGILIHGDSRLVVEQVNEKWAINAPLLKPLHARCLELLKPLSPWACEWIPRERNVEADELSRKAYIEAEGKAPPERAKHRKSA